MIPGLVRDQGLGQGLVHGRGLAPALAPSLIPALYPALGQGRDLERGLVQSAPQRLTIVASVESHTVVASLLLYEENLGHGRRVRN